MNILDDVRTKISQQISAARMSNDVKYLAKLGPRHAATEREYEAARYVEKMFRETGVNVRVDKVEDIKAWYPHESRFRVVEPVAQELNCVAVLGSGATPKDGITGEVEYVGRGKKEDYENRSIKDKFIFRDPPRNLMLDNLTDESAPQGPTKYLLDKGVAGFIEHSRQKGRIFQVDLLSGPGHLPVPAVALTYEDGQYLKELIREWYAIPNGYRRLKEKPVKIWVYVDAESKDSYGLNVIASIKGTERADEKVLLLAHHDSAYGPGACDNATAVAVNLELARVLSKLGRPKRTIEFCSLTGEEYGEVGAEAYVKKYISDTSKYKGCINMDIIGNGDHLYYITESVCLGKIVRNTPWLNKYLQKVTESLGYVIEPIPLEFAGDDGPFLLKGVPTSYICKLITPSWPWLHTDMDDFSVVDINGLKVIAEIVANTLWGLANG